MNVRWVHGRTPGNLELSLGLPLPLLASVLYGRPSGWASMKGTIGHCLNDVMTMRRLSLLLLSAIASLIPHLCNSSAYQSMEAIHDHQHTGSFSLAAFRFANVMTGQRSVLRFF